MAPPGGFVRGLMMNSPLLVTSFIDRAAELFGDVEIVSRRADRSIHRYTYKECRDRARRLATALRGFGLQPGDRVGTLMWNHYAHFEAYFGVPLAGGVFHTLSLRLHPPDIARIAKHAGDRFVIVDEVLLPLWEKVAADFKPERVIVVSSSGARIQNSYDDYETVIHSVDRPFVSVEAHEDDAIGLCYTSGTTGMPKGVLYSHRALALHALGLALPDVLGLRQSDVMLPIVPMFHVNAWGLPFAAAMLGIKIVLPGPCMDSPSICELFNSEGVTLTAGVPTVWLAMLRYLEENPESSKVPPGMRLLVGGAALPEWLIREFQKRGMQMIQGWGMTETSPAATISSGVKTSHMTDDKRAAALARQGLPLPFVDIRTVNSDGICPHDGQTMGELEVRGPWVASGYFGSTPEPGKWSEDGWFRTGDVATLDSDHYMRITDRTKDLIKSGGEWISSVDLENALMSHPAVQESAVIAIPDPKWMERPLAVVVLKPGAETTPEALRDHIAPGFPKWWLPDKFVFAKEIPRTATGKFLKTKLRELYAQPSKSNSTA
jgi:fatty-acyl-CoA synthase